MNSAKALKGSARAAVRRGGGLLAAAFVLSFLVNVLRLAGPMFMILIYDRVLTSRSVETLVALVVLVMLLLLVLGILDYARKRLLARFGAQFQEQMEETLLQHSGRNHLFQHNKSKPVVGLDEVDGLRGFFHSGSLIAIFDFIWAPMFVAVVFILHPLLGWACLAGVAIIATLAGLQALFMGGRKERAMAASGEVGRLKTVLLTSRETVRSHDMGVGFNPRWLTARNTARDDSIALRDWTSWFESMSRITTMVVRYAVLATGAYLTLQSALTVGAMVAATFLVTRILGPVDRFFVQIPKVAEARGNWQRLTRILTNRAEELPDDYADQPGALHRLELTSVSVRSPLTNAMILRSVSLTANAGEIIEINGLSSQGKTVLLETILGMWAQNSGSVLVNGRHTSRLSEAEAREIFGYAPETPGFVAGTIEENISGFEANPDPEKVSHAAWQARMHAAISALPDGYKTQIDARGSCLSGFERYQLSLARALYHKPQVLLIDQLDSDMLVRIPKKLKQTLTALKEAGTTIILTAREPLGLDYTDRQFTLKDGKLSKRSSAASSSNQNRGLADKTAATAEKTRPIVSVVSDSAATQKAQPKKAAKR